MPELVSTVSDAISLEWVDHTRHECVVVRGNGFSYTVYPHDRTMTGGDLEAMKRLAMPNEQTNGATMRIATVYDEVLAERHGFKGRSYFVRILSTGPDADPDRLKTGNYYELSLVGWGTELETQEQKDPQFRMLWLDAADVMSDDIEPGRIFVRGLIETTDARYDPEQEIIFVGNELADYSATGQLIDRFWARYGASSIYDFEKIELPGVRYPDQTGAQLIAGGVYSEPVNIQLNEQLDTYRLHTKMAVRLECVDEMCQDIKAVLIDRRIPESEIVKAVAKRETATGYQFAMSI